MPLYHHQQSANNLRYQRPFFSVNISAVVTCHGVTVILQQKSRSLASYFGRNEVHDSEFLIARQFRPSSLSFLHSANFDFQGRFNVSYLKLKYRISISAAKVKLRYGLRVTIRLTTLL
jgi:hypothetical protein